RGRRTIVVRSDHQHTFSPGVCCTFNLSNRPTRALLPRADDESEFWRHSSARSLYHLNVFAFVEVDSLSGRAKDHVSAHARAVPLLDIRGESIGIEIFVEHERRSDWQQQAAQFNC